MTANHIPKGVSLETLRDVVEGWDAVGAAAEPKYTSAVEDATGITDAVGRQTRFLEDVGVLEAEQQKHRLTDRGQALAGALAVDDEQRARENARELLWDWPVTEAVRGVVRGNPTDEESLVPLVAAITDQDLDASRVRSGVTTLLDLYEWAGLLERDEDGRYRLPAEERTPDETGEGTAEAAVEAGEEAGAAAEASEEAGAAAEAAATEAEETAGEASEAAETVASGELESAVEAVTESTPTETAKAPEELEGLEPAVEEVAETVGESTEEAVEAGEPAVEAVAEEAESAAGASEDEEGTADAVESVTDIADEAGRGSLSDEEAAEPEAEPETEAEPEAGTEPADGETSPPAVELELGDGAEVRIAVSEEDGIEIGVDGDVDLTNLETQGSVDVEGLADQVTGDESEDLKPDGGEEQATQADIDVSEEGETVKIEIGAEPGVTISVGGEIGADEGGEEAEETAEEDEEAGADEAAEPEGTSEEEGAREAGEETAEAAGETAEEGAQAATETEAAAAGEAVPAEVIEAAVEEADVSDLESLLTAVEEASEQATEAAEEAQESAQAGSGVSATGDSTLSLGVDLDADPEDLEVLVRSIRRGLVEADEDDADEG